MSCFAGIRQGKVPRRQTRCSPCDRLRVSGHGNGWLAAARACICAGGKLSWRRCVVECRVPGLDGEVVVGTSGARGMGAAHVRGFLTEGVKVAAADLSWDVVEACRAEVEAADG